MCPLAIEMEALGVLYHSLVCTEFIFNEIQHNLLYKFVAMETDYSGPTRAAQGSRILSFPKAVLLLLAPSSECGLAEGDWLVAGSNGDIRDGTGFSMCVT